MPCVLLCFIGALIVSISVPVKAQCPPDASQGTLNIKPLQEVEMAKYIILGITTDYAPVRLAPDVSAKRFSHLREGVTLYADSQNKNFYRVDLGTGRPYWIEKKFVEPQTMINEKLLSRIEGVTFSEDKELYSVKITTKDFQGPYQTVETPEGLTFNFYDAQYSPSLAKVECRPKCFTLDEGENNTFSINYAADGPLVGYGVVRERDGYLITVKKIPKINKKKPLKGLVIAVDPGHGGLESGAVAKLPDGTRILEKNINLEISKHLQCELEQAGAEVIMTRETDKDVELYRRVELAKEDGAMFLISIHQNALPPNMDINKKHGVGVYYYNDMAKPMAQAFQDELLKATCFRDDGVNFASFALTRPTEVVAVLVECGYLIRPQELEKLMDEDFQKEIAKAIRVGMENYIENLDSRKDAKNIKKQGCPI